MPVAKLTPTFTFTEDRLQALQAVVPEAFADGQVNWATLKEALAPHLEDEGPGTEHFGLFWPGKRQARRMAAQPSKGTLRPVKGEGVNEDTTGNLFIEGDNLEVLKLLQKSYAGRVKLIYIDPPYNTGNDFVYKDNFAEPLAEYLQRTGQADAEGLLTTNPKAGGRFHSNWLNMMLPRLMLARTLLSDDGVIFVSIDDNEVANLRQMMDEVFGEENFIAQLVWKSRQSEDTRAKTGVSNDHEYIFCYGKSGSVTLIGVDKDLNKFSNPDNDPRGPWRSADLTGLATKSQRPNLHYEVIDKKTNTNYGCPPKGWRYEPIVMAKKIDEGRVLFPSNENGRPRHKLFLNEMRSLYKNISSIITNKSTADGTRECNEIIGSGVFYFPKPYELIKLLLSQSAYENGNIIIDFFSGSCSTAQAVLELNREDGGNRKFIMVQMPEPTPKDSSARQGGYKTIADIGKERIRRVIAKLDKQPVLDRDPPEDLGFAVYKLDRSHFKDDLFSDQIDPLLPGWQPRALLDEILLLQGFPLDSRRTRLKSLKSNVVVQVDCEWFSYRLFVCLDATLNPATLDALPLNLDDKFIGLDSALTDQTKQELTDRCTLVVL